MVRCPVCEHTQAGGPECEGCGKKLAPAAPVKVAAVAIPELEVTHHANGRANVAVAPMTELEGTLHLSEPDWPGEDVADLQRTQFEAAAAVAAPAIPELERHRAPMDGQKTQLPADAGSTCRYCRNVQATGLMCDRCGMRLPRVSTARAAPAAGASGAGKSARNLEPVKTRCRSCGATATGGMPCGDCGRLVPMPEA